MSAEIAIFQSLKDLVGGRVSPDVAPDNQKRPYAVYQQVGGEALNFMDSSIPGKRNGRFQINVWADTRKEASDIAKQVEDAMRVSMKATVLGAPTALYERDMRLHGTRQDFSVWHD